MNPKNRQASKHPRIDSEQRRLSRLYEPLLLLHVLDPYGERKIISQLPQDVDVSSMRRTHMRRLFLRQLAYVCDDVPGGDTVTAMLLEAQPSGVVLWVTANTNVTGRTLTFLENILGNLRSATSGPIESRDGDVEAKLGKAFVEFNRKRLKHYAQRIQAPIQRCLEFLRESEVEDDILLTRFLQSLDSLRANLPELCDFAYKNRSCSDMKVLRVHAGDKETGVALSESRKAAFILTRHYTGRLGSHLRAAKIVATIGRHMPYLFEDFSIERLPAPKPPCMPPQIDALTTLPGILKRMLPKDSDQLTFYQQALEEMDAKFEITLRLHALYKDKDFKPRVHAELNLLEWAYAKKLAFDGNDRYIACSKPACFCCYHYINQHPGQFVVPPSHGKRYVAWRPPGPDRPEDAAEMKHSRDMINAVIAQIRREALRNIELRKGPSLWHPDSTTGITVSHRPGLSLRGADEQRVPVDQGLTLYKLHEVPSELTTELDRLHITPTEMTKSFEEVSAEVSADWNEQHQGSDEEDPDSDGGVYIGSS